MSLSVNLAKHLALTPQQAQIVFNELKEFVELTYSTNIPNNNKLIVSQLRKILKEKFQITLAQQKAYETLSKILGYKNYNVALFKRANFTHLFLEPSMLFIPTGLTALDLDLGGGLPRGKVSCIFAGSNEGKSLFSISVSSNVLRLNKRLKILHINIEGSRDKAMLRYMANLAEVPYGDIIKSSSHIQAKLESVKINYGPDRLLIRNMISFGVTIEDVVEYCKEIYKDFKFDLIVLDSAQLLESKVKLDYRKNIINVFEGLNLIAKEFNCSVLTPVQLTTKLLKEPTKFLRAAPTVEMYGIDNLISVTITLEKKDHFLKVYLETKDSQPKDKSYQVKPNYAYCNLIPK